MKRPKRTRRATGIFSDIYGFAVITKVHGIQQERRYAPESSLDHLIAARVNWIIERKRGGTSTSDPLFTDAATGFLATFPSRSRRKVDAENAIGHWRSALSALTLTQITPEIIATQLAQWEHAKVANSTRRHRRRELGNLFTWKYGLGGINPVRAVPRPPKTRRERPRDFPYVLGRLILFQMRRSQNKARLRVMLETGWPHVVIARLTKADLNLRTRRVYIAPRRKGKGIPGRSMPITKRAVTALREFAKQDAFGAFSASSMQKAFTLAIEKAQAIWEAHSDDPWPAPTNLHPYDLRHAFISRMVRTKGIEAASYLAIHSDIRQTQEYAAAAFYDLAVEAVKE